MKKLFFVVVAIAIVALAVVNLNLALNNKQKVSVALGNFIAVAQNEQIIYGYCDHDSYLIDQHPCGSFTVVYRCDVGGTSAFCREGETSYNCYWDEVYDNTYVYSCFL